MCQRSLQARRCSRRRLVCRHPSHRRPQPLLLCPRPLRLGCYGCADGFATCKGRRRSRLVPPCICLLVPPSLLLPQRRRHERLRRGRPGSSTAGQGLRLHSIRRRWLRLWTMEVVDSGRHGVTSTSALRRLPAFPTAPASTMTSLAALGSPPCTAPAPAPLCPATPPPPAPAAPRTAAPRQPRRTAGGSCGSAGKVSARSRPPVEHAAAWPASHATGMAVHPPRRRRRLLPAAPAARLLPAPGAPLQPPPAPRVGREAGRHGLVGASWHPAPPASQARVKMACAGTCPLPLLHAFASSAVCRLACAAVMSWMRWLCDTLACGGRGRGPRARARPA